MSSSKVALIETKPSKTDFAARFEHEFEFDRYTLCSDPNIKKVLKKDCDINIDTDQYDWIILVGSDALKYFTKINSITEYSGKLVNNKFLPIINPAMLAFKPEAKTTWDTSKDNVIAYIKGTLQDIVIDDTMVRGIQDYDECTRFLKEALAYHKPYFGIDSETTALYPRDGYILGISISYNGEQGVYITADCIIDENEKLLQELFNKKTPIFHNAKFDITFFEYCFNIKVTKFEDTMLLHYLIDEVPGTHGLKQLALKYTKFGDYEKELYQWIEEYRKVHRILKDEFQWEWIPFDTMVPYASMDALVTFVIYEKFVKIKENPKLKKVYDDILIPGSRFLIGMQNNGVPFDKTRLYEAQERIQHDIDEAITKLYTHPQIAAFEKAQGKEFNPNSVVQLRVLLFDYLGLKPTGKKTDKGAHSTDAEVLQLLSKHSEVPGLILNIRQQSKIKNTYLDKIIPQLDSDSRLRTGFNLHSTTSGRLSSSGKLNMQQIPRDNPIVKGCIKAGPNNKIVSLDLQTAEVYVAAVLSGDKALMDVFRQGGNLHSTIAKKVFKLPCPVEEVAEKFKSKRQAAKAISFGIMYGAGPPKISEQVTKDSGIFFSVAEATEVIEEYFGTFKSLKVWIEKNQDFIKTNGFIYSYFGRKRRLPNVKSSDRGLASHSIRSGLNFLVQSVASDINFLGAIDTQKYIEHAGLNTKIFAVVHDSILAEVPENEIEEYKTNLIKYVQLDRGITIPGCPIGCDINIGDDYSFGKYEEKYG